MRGPLTEQERASFARNPEAIPADVQCDRCDRQAVARGTDGRQAFALCADDYLEETLARRNAPRVDAATRAAAILEAVR